MCVGVDVYKNNLPSCEIEPSGNKTTIGSLLNLNLVIIINHLASLGSGGEIDNSFNKCIYFSPRMLMVVIVKSGCPVNIACICVAKSFASLGKCL